MNVRQVLAKLKALGTAQNRKIYARHGISGVAYGVSYANLGSLKKQLKIDHALATALWQSGNHDAQVLATMVADPKQTTARQLEGWAKDLDNHVLCGALSDLAAQSPAAHSLAKKWVARKGEWHASAGWSLFAQLALDGECDIDDGEWEAHLQTIEATIHQSKNRVRYSMNNALIAIGLRSAVLQQQAIVAARRIGVVEVDHGETSCKTPDAVAYIEKSAKRKQAAGKRA